MAAAQTSVYGPLTLEEQIERWESDPPLSAEEGWDLLFSLFGSAKKLYAKYGGGEAFLRSERASWGGDTSE